MKEINTVLGKITADELGVVTTHEHILLDLTAFYQALPVKGIKNPAKEKVKMENLGILSRDCYALKDNLLLNNIKVQTKEISYFKEAGGNTVVDASLTGIGRNPKALKKIAKKVGLNIIMGTGFYVGETHPKKLSSMSEEEIADIMIDEIQNGVDGTDIKAGYIGEIGISEIFDDKERKVLRSAGIAQKKTGVAINVHINPWTTNGLEASQILLDLGVLPQKICISHIDVENRIDYIYELLKRGVYVEFDNFGKEYYIKKEVRNSGYGLFVHDIDRVKLIKKLIDDGYINQLLLSCDLCLKNLLHKYGGWGYDHVLTNVVPMLQEEGITDEQINILLKDNPKRWLVGDKEN